MSIYSEIEAKRNQEINERNLLSMLIEEQGNSHEDGQRPSGGFTVGALSCVRSGERADGSRLLRSARIRCATAA